MRIGVVPRSFVTLLVLVGPALAVEPSSPAPQAQAQAQQQQQQQQSSQPLPPSQTPPPSSPEPRALPPPAPATPPPPLAQPLAPPAGPPLTVQAPAPPGQWVFTSQYGWLWMPYDRQYTYVAPDSSVANMYVYYPAFGWRWVPAPWVLGFGSMPYWGRFGYARFAWYAHPWFGVGVRYRGWGPRFHGHVGRYYPGRVYHGPHGHR